MSKVATMLIRHNDKRFEIGDELPDKLVEKLGEDHTAVGDPPKKKKKKADDEDKKPDGKKTKSKKDK